MDDATLAALEHENMIAAISVVGAHVPGGVVRRQEGVACIATGLPMRLFNQVAIEDDDASDRAVADAVAVVRDRGDLFVVNLRAGTDDGRLGLIERLGLTPISETPWMPGMAATPISTIDAPPADGLRIVRVVDPAGLEAHISAAAAGFEMPATLVSRIVAPVMLDDPDVWFYVGFAGDRPVSSGLGIRTGRTIGVYNISTAPSHRRRGYGAAITVRIVADGHAAGCDVAVLQASDMGRPTYERLGFRTVIDYMGYVDPASLAD
jgi:GNAT superfamily N-acetyltransferase